MAIKSGPPPIVYILIALGLIGGLGWWFFLRKPGGSPTVDNSVNVPGINSGSPSFSLPTSVPSGTTIRVDGSTSMVKINQSLKQGFQSQFPGTSVVAQAAGSDRGIQALLSNQTDVAAVSRNLTAQEQGQGLVALPVTSDAIAVIVGVENPFRTGLSSSQVVQIFQGQITDWSAVGGSPGQIRVINRPSFSGTHQAFQELVLNGGSFGTTPNITTMQQDATTPLLRALKTNGIGYATYAQVATQRTVRTVAIDGVTPEAANYPFKRSLYYVYKSPPSPQVEAFLGYVMSPQGQQAIAFGASN